MNKFHKFIFKFFSKEDYDYAKQFQTMEEFLANCRYHDLYIKTAAAGCINLEYDIIKNVCLAVFEYCINKRKANKCIERGLFIDFCDELLNTKECFDALRENIVPSILKKFNHD